jgi:CBS domain-containing protein
MRVSGILASKGATVATIPPDATVADAAGELRLRGVGALVVSGDGRHIEGILSERDVVRRLAERGEHALSERVAELMTTNVRTCTPDDAVDDLMRRMTEHRMRHLPVVVDGELAGIVSIGDVVKWRVEELEDEARRLHDYVTTGRG